MSQPWMPLYIADYLADTSHLRAVESGAYLHLIMHYWQQGSLPDDDRKLATIAKLTDVEWRRHRPTLIGFFQPGWRHARIEKELARAAERYRQRVEAGRRGGRPRETEPKPDGYSPLNREESERVSETKARRNQPQPHSSEELDRTNRARARDPAALVSEGAILLAKQALSAIGADIEAPEWGGFPYIVQAWLTLGCTPVFIMQTVTYAASRHTRTNQKYLDASVRGAFEDSKTKPPKMERTCGQPGRDNRFGAALDELRESIAADERRTEEGCADVVRLLPDRRSARP